MPYGIPYTDEERKRRHLSQYGTLKNFPETRQGKGRGWREQLSVSASSKPISAAEKKRLAKLAKDARKVR